MDKNLKEAILRGLIIIAVYALILIFILFLFETSDTLFTCRLDNCSGISLPRVIFVVPLLVAVLTISYPIQVIDKIIGTKAFPPYPPIWPLINIKDFMIDIFIIGVIVVVISVLISSLISSFKHK